MSDNNTILTNVDGTIGIITLNRLNESNAVNLEMLNEIAYQIQEWDYDDAIKACEKYMLSRTSRRKYFPNFSGR